uniref:Serpentine receptor class gamma n=1 Tax=Globodera rostochiensis TaxID=31243 RepID=A0A914H3L0_GLORO
MVYLIVRHTPKSMRMYSKILLQTCATDLAFLTINLLFHQYMFTTDKGESVVITDGLITFNGTQNRGWNLLAWICSIFLVYVSLFGYVAQFIYRYLLLNWDKKLSAFKYFILFGAILFFPFVYCVDLFICYYPPTDHLYLEDQSVADILALNITEQIALTGHSFNDWRQAMGSYYIITACTIAYIIMITLAFLMDKLLKGRLKFGPSSAQTLKIIEMNKQISRNLIIQASMPFVIYLSILFLLGIMLFKIDVSRWNWLQYYNMLTSIPMFLPSALNPIVSICIIHIPSMALYIAEIVTIVRHKKFHNSFYALFVMRAIPVLLNVLNSFYGQRLPSIIGAVLYPIYSKFPNWMLAMFYFLGGHTFQANNLVTAFILLNRLTAIIMPMKHEKLWRKLLPLLKIFVLCVPILTCWPVLKLDGIILLNNPNSTTDRSFVMYEAGDAPYISYITYISTVFSAIFMIICVLINICTLVAYKLHKKLLVYALATFFGHALVASLFLIILITNIDDPKTKTMLYVYYTLIMDIGTVLLSSCLLLWASGTFRQQLLKDFGIIRINNVQNIRVDAQEEPRNNNFRAMKISHQLHTRSIQITTIS